MHHEAFTTTLKKIHAAATKAGIENLARELMADNAGSTNIGVMFDGMWQKRGHKSHRGCVIALAAKLCLKVLSNYCLGCSGHKALQNQEEICQAISHINV